MQPEHGGSMATPHMCLQTYQCDEGIILRYLCWGARDPSPAAPIIPCSPPPPPLQGAKMFKRCQGQGLHLNAPMTWILQDFR